MERLSLVHQPGAQNSTELALGVGPLLQLLLLLPTLRVAVLCGGEAQESGSAVGRTHS